MPFSATSVLVVTVKKLPNRMLRIGASFQLSASFCTVELEKRGVSRTLDKLKRWRRSMAELEQLARSNRRLAAFVYPPLALPPLISVVNESLMQCDQV